MFDPSPVTSQPVRLLQGRYGPYVSDGATNASLPRGTMPEEVTFEYALNLLKERAAAGSAKRRRARRRQRRQEGGARKKAAAGNSKPAAAKRKAGRRGLTRLVHGDTLVFGPAQ